MSGRTPQRRPPAPPKAEDEPANGTDPCNKPQREICRSWPRTLRVERYALTGSGDGRATAASLGTRTVETGGANKVDGVVQPTNGTGRPVSIKTVAQDPIGWPQQDNVVGSHTLSNETTGNGHHTQQTTNAQPKETSPYHSETNGEEGSSIECESEDGDGTDTDDFSISVHSEDEEGSPPQNCTPSEPKVEGLRIDTSISRRQSFDSSGSKRGSTSPALSSPASNLKDSTQGKILDFLLSVPLVHGIKANQLFRLVNECKIQVFDKGTTVIEEGQKSEDLYIIEHGTVCVYQTENGPTPRELRLGPRTAYGYKVGVLSRGQFFGERGIILRCERSATCVARSRIRCIVISRILFDTVLAETRPLLRLHILRYTSVANKEKLALERHVREFLNVVIHSSRKGKTAQKGRSRSIVNGSADSEKLSPSWISSAESAGIGSDPSMMEEFGSSFASGSDSSIDLAGKESAAHDPTLLSLMSCFSPELEFVDIMDRFLKTTCKVFNAERAGIYCIRNDKNAMTLFHSDCKEEIEIPISGIVEFVIRSGSFCVVPDTSREPRFDRDADSMFDRPTKNILCYPLKQSEPPHELIGVIEISNKNGSDFNNHDLAILASISNQVGIMLENRWSGRDQKASPTWMVNTNMNVVVHSIQHIPLAKGHGAFARFSRSFARKDKVTVACSLFHGNENLCEPVELSTNDVDKVPHSEAVLSYGKSQECASSSRKASISTNFSDSLTENEGNSGPTFASAEECFSSSKGYNYATATIGKCLRSGEEVRFSNYTHVINAKLEDTMQPQKSIRELPKAARMIFQVRLNNDDVAWTGCNMFSSDRKLINGRKRLYLWPGRCPHPMVTTLQNRHEAFPIIMDVEFTNSSKEFGEIVFADHNASDDHFMQETDPFACNDAELDPAVEEIICRDPLATVTPEEKDLLWGYRYVLTRHPRALPKVLKSVNWGNRQSVLEMYRLLHAWTQPGPLTALQLLDSQFPDPNVRAYAVACLENLPDDDLALYLLQLTQVLKYEPFDDSALSRFLLRRALLRPRLLGHELFWYLRAELHNIDIARRFSMLLDLFMRYCGSHKLALGHQIYVIEKLYKISERVIDVKGDPRAMNDVARAHLADTVWPAKFQIPLRPSFVAHEFVVRDCKVMSSKKVPLWLSLLGNETVTTAAKGSSVDSFETAEPKPSRFTVIFKNGDDLRQDQLTLQLIRIMDRLWKSEGLDLCVSAYECVATGLDLGMLEVVEDSETFANIIGKFQQPNNRDRVQSELSRQDSHDSEASDGDLERQRDRGYSLNDMQAGSFDSACEDTEEEEEENDDKAKMKRKPSGIFTKIRASKRVYQNDIVKKWLKQKVEDATRRDRFRSQESESSNGWDHDSQQHGRLTRARSVSSQGKHHGPTTSSPLVRSPLVRGYSYQSSLRKGSEDSSAGDFTRNWYAAQDRFARSCAGYCVATYVMGIGDRHSDNYMLRTDGAFFHIDFGHFLGNFKSKLGVNRERAPFRFTPAMAEVLDGTSGPTFERFIKYAGRAYNILRRHSHLLITLFSLMVSAGLPELEKPQDVDWVRDKLRLDLTDEEAFSHFRDLIFVSLRTKFTQFDDTIHVFKHT